jgi:hypothetical protein
MREIGPVAGNWGTLFGGKLRSLDRSKSDCNPFFLSYPVCRPSPIDRILEKQNQPTDLCADTEKNLTHLQTVLLFKDSAWLHRFVFQLIHR